MLVKAFGDGPDYPASAVEYHYDEAACPSDILRSVEEVFIDSDGDPHGICEYVRTVEVDVPSGGYNPDELWSAAIPEAFD